MKKIGTTNLTSLYKIITSSMFVFFLTASFPSASQESLRITYPSLRYTDSIDRTFIKDVIKLAIDKSGYSAVIEPSAKGFDSDVSIFRSLVNNEDITIMWSGSNSELEKQARAIYFPIFKGLLGYRLIVSNNNASEYVCKSKNIRDLTGFIFGLGYGWAEVNIFEDNGIPLLQADRVSLYRFTSSQDIEVFSRSIFEAAITEKKLISKHSNLSICDNLALYYPHYLYFYVNKQNEILYNAINEGLKKSIKDGSFDKLFYQSLQNSGIDIKSLLKGKRVINIENNFMSERTKKIPNNLKAITH